MVDSRIAQPSPPPWGPPRPSGAAGSPDVQPGTRVTMQSILEGVHQRYSRQIAALVQENAEVAAALEAETAARQEAESKLAALSALDE